MAAQTEWLLAQEGSRKPPTLPDTNVEAQPMAPGNQAPTLPDTNVEASPLAPMNQPANNDPFQGNLPFDNGNTWPGGSILQGGIFSSGPVQGYRAGASTASTLLDVPDADVPGTVNVISRDTFSDQQILQIGDLARNAAGTLTSPNGGGFFYDQLFVRGMLVGSRDFRRDGFLDPTFVPRDFYNIERVEILKGPASMLYGVGSPSGMVNLITKKPIDDQFTNFNYTFGAYQQSRYTLDTNGRATQSGNVLYRFNAVHEDRNNFRDFDFLSRTAFAPSVSWLIDESTSLTYQAEWHQDHRRGDQGIPAIGGNALALPGNTFVGSTEDFLHAEEFRQSLLLTHEINENWTARLGASTLWYSFPGSFVRASDGFGFPQFPPAVYHYRSSGTASEESHSVVANLAGDFETGAFRHRAVVGAEYAYFNSASTFQLDVLTPSLPNGPVPSTTPIIPFPIQATNAPAFRQQRTGVYAQDLVDLNPYWKALGGVRVDYCNFVYDRTNTFPNPFFPVGPPTVSFSADTDQQFYQASPRGGLIYQPFADESLAYYFNYSTSFQPPGGGVYLNTNPLQPITGQAYEVGIKTTLMENLTLNAAGFYATRNNADLYDGSFALIQVGQERAQGVEVSLVGNLTSRLSTIANYTYVDSRLYDPTFAINGIPNPLNGQQQRNVPYNSANIWTRYDAVQDELQTFGVALGMIAVGDRPGDLANTFDLPGYCRWDGGVYYRRGTLTANIYLENLFNTYYATSSLSPFQVYPGAPLNARATVGWTF